MTATPPPSPTAPRAGRIVAGVDGSDGSRRGVQWAAEYANLSGCELRLVTAWHWPAMYGAVPAPDIDFEGDARAVVVGISDELRRRFPSLDIGFDVRSGPAAQALIDASRGADLLVGGLTRPRRLRRHADRLGEPALRPPRPLPGGRGSQR